MINNEEHQIAILPTMGYGWMRSDPKQPGSFRIDVGFDDWTEDHAEAGYVVFYTQSANERLRYRMTPEIARMIGNAFCAAAAEAESEIRRRIRQEVEDEGKKEAQAHC